MHYSEPQKRLLKTNSTKKSSQKCYITPFVHMPPTKNSCHSSNLLWQQRMLWSHLYCHNNFVAWHRKSSGGQQRSSRINCDLAQELWLTPSTQPFQFQHYFSCTSSGHEIMDKTKVEKRKEKSLCLRRSSGNLWGADGLHPPRVVAHASLPPPTFARLPLPAPIHWLLKYFPIHCNTSTRSASPPPHPPFQAYLPATRCLCFLELWHQTSGRVSHFWTPLHLQRFHL